MVRTSTTRTSKTGDRPQLKPKLPDIRLTHPDRVVYPDRGITKRDLAAYYAQVADWMLPHIIGRPLALVRCPAGVDGPHFFQKHPPEGLPSVVQRIRIQEKNQMNTYLIVNDLEGLVTLVQFGALEIHIWGARGDDVERPDRLVFDLDPDPAVGWGQVVEAAFLLRGTLSEIGLTSFVKTTGGKGLHVVVPVDRRLGWADVKPFCKAVAGLLETTAPERFLTNMSKAARRGKIFIDYLRNERGATAVAPYSCRARAGAPVAMPLSWEELSNVKGPQEFTVENVPQRLAGLKRDPWRDLVRTRQTVTAQARKLIAGAGASPQAGSSRNGRDRS